MKIKNMNNAGATLVELMVYMIVGLIVITGALRVISNATGSYVHGRSVSKAQYGARDGIASISRDIASMGYKTYFSIDSDGKAKVSSENFKELFSNLFPTNPNEEDCDFIYIPNNIGNGDTLEFFRIKINNDTGLKMGTERIKYYLDEEVNSNNEKNNKVVRVFRSYSGDDANDSPNKQETTIIASNVAALRFRFGKTGNNDWVSDVRVCTNDCDNNSSDTYIYNRNVRNVEVSILVKSDKDETGTYGAAVYEVGGRTYNTPDEDRQKVHRLYQQAVEVPNNGRGN